MVFPLDMVFYNRAQHDRRNEAASQKLVPDKVQPQKEAPEGQLRSLVLFIVAGNMEYLIHPFSVFHQFQKSRFSGFGFFF